MAINPHAHMRNAAPATIVVGHARYCRVPSLPVIHLSLAALNRCSFYRCGCLNSARGPCRIKLDFDE